MNEIERLLGREGRMIAWSKSGYDRDHPDHVAVFNANLCVAGRKCWHGDLDLTLDEPLLRELAGRLGEQVAVLYERDARFDTEHTPRLENALLVIEPDGSSRFDERQFERVPDGTLRRRPPEPLPEPSGRVVPFDWDGNWRPRLLRFWQLEHKPFGGRLGPARQHGHLLYMGARDQGRTPLLVLCVFRDEWHDTALGGEITWYPSRRPYRRGPLLELARRRRRGRVQPYLYLLSQPGFIHELRFGVHLGDGRW